MAGFIFSFLAVLFIAASANPTTNEQESRLQIINAENNVLEAIFFTAETGIRIYGDSSSITVTSMSNNEVLMSGSAPSDSSRLYRVLDSNFLLEKTTGENGEPIKHQFIVPESLIDRVKEDIKTRKEQRITSQLTGQSASEVRTAEEQAFLRLFARHEISLIRPAAKALGRAGVMGYENRGALYFYGIAMALGKALHRQNMDTSGDWEGSGDATDMGRRKREFIDDPRPDFPTNRPRHICWWPWFYPPSRPRQCWISPISSIFLGRRSTQQQEHMQPQKRLTLAPGYRCCSCSDEICRTGFCIPGTRLCNGMCPDWLNCYGRCGGEPGCTECIREMCGTCCYQKGCYDHDLCCEDRGYMSPPCMFLFDFSCTEGYTCWC
jgi:hypothetical protein